MRWIALSCSLGPRKLLKTNNEYQTRKQLLKVLTTPVIVAVQWFMYGNKLPHSQVLALVPTCIGVILATVTHLEANFWGMVFGGCGILSTSMYQIWVKTEQENLKVSPQQLLHNQARVSFVFLCVLAPLLEDITPSSGSEALLRMKWVS